MWYFQVTIGFNTKMIVYDLDDDWGPKGTLETSIHENWIGLREDLQENPIFTGKIYGFRLRFSLIPIHWYMKILNDICYKKLHINTTYHTIYIYIDCWFFSIHDTSIVGS